MVGLEVGTNGGPDNSSITRLPSIYPQCYTQSELRVLNELDYPVWISSYQPGDTHFLWANDAALSLWSTSSLEALGSTEIVSTRSMAISAIHEEIFNDVQA